MPSVAPLASAPMPAIEQASLPTQPLTAAPVVPKVHCGKHRPMPAAPVDTHKPGEVESSGPSQKCRLPSLPGSQLPGMRQTGVGKSGPSEKIALVVHSFTPGPVTEWQSVSLWQDLPVVPSYVGTVPPLLLPLLLPLPPPLLLPLPLPLPPPLLLLPLPLPLAEAHACDASD
jgi:hypothetical protein